MKNLPLKIVIEIDSTNLSTRRKALERLNELMNETGHSEPHLYQIIWDKEFMGTPYWRLKVIALVNSLEPKPRKSLNKKRKSRA